MDEIAFASAGELAVLVRDRKLSPVELVETFLARIEKFDSVLNAFVTVAAEQALDAAGLAQERVANEDASALPPFLGVPIAIKDTTETAGIRTTHSSKAFADHVPEVDDSVVRRLKEAGFIVLGKTNAPEFATLPVTESELNGAARNPWDTDRTPGGSTGGGAAAVAAGLVPVAQGTDGGGSLRTPASCCGLFGLKPAVGRVSWAPRLGSMWSGFGSNGVITRSVPDSAAILDAIAGYEPGDVHWLPAPERPFAEEVGADPGELKVAVTTVSGLGGPVEVPCEAALRDAAELLTSLGHRVEEVDPNWGDDELFPMFFRLWQVGNAYYDVRDISLLEPINREFALAAAEASSLDYVRARVWMDGYARRVAWLWRDYDIVLTPTQAMAPVPIGWMFEDENPWMQFTRAGLFTPFAALANITGQPAASVPLWWSEDGLPIGVQLFAGPADEATLFRLSAQLEEARPWAGRHPPVS